MAIAYDAHATTSGATGWFATSNSWTHTVGAGANNIAIVVLIASKAYSTFVDNPDTVTFGGSAMTLLAKYTGGTTEDSIYIYYRKSVSTGNNTVVVNLAEGNNPGDVGSIFSLTFTGVDQTTPFRVGHGGTEVYDTEVSLETTTVAGDVVLSLFSCWECLEYTEGSGQTVVHYNSRASDYCNASIKTASGVSTTNSWTKDSTYRYLTLYGAALVPYSGAIEDTISEDFTINASIDAWKTPDTLSENFTINADMKASAEIDGPISENFTINAVASLIRETPKEANEGFTINADMDVIATCNKTFDGSDATISAAIQANSTYNKGLATTAYLGSFMDAEFEYPVKRKKMPYRAQGKRLSIKIECTDKGSWMKLLDISAKVLPMVGRTQSDATKVRGTGNHVGVKISNTDGAAIQLSYVGMKIERYPAR